jgi:hypothetical protein
MDAAASKIAPTCHDSAAIHIPTRLKNTQSKHNNIKQMGNASCETCRGKNNLQGKSNRPGTLASYAESQLVQATVAGM